MQRMAIIAAAAATFASGCATLPPDDPRTCSQLQDELSAAIKTYGFSAELAQARSQIVPAAKAKGCEWSRMLEG